MAVVDFSAKLQSGVISGNYQNPGNFRECVKFKHEEGSYKIEGQHCMVFYVATRNASENDSNSRWKDLWVQIEIKLRKFHYSIKKNFRGNIARTNQLRLRSGFCFPSSCSETEVVQFSNEILLQADLVAIFTFCQKNDPKQIEAIDIVAM